jgi:mannitol/fructose-specific phosphotransferase system IIA component (Ntr-type)
MLPVFIEPEWITNVDSQPRDELLDLMVGRLATAIKSVPQGRLLQAILLREKQCPTVVSEQLAVPHAKLAGLSAFYAALARCEDGIEFAPQKRVKTVCLLLGPDKAQKQYLELLASILRLFQDKGQKMATAELPQLHRMLVSAAETKR